MRNPIVDAGEHESVVPELGQHSEEILCELGYAEHEIVPVLQGTK